MNLQTLENGSKVCPDDPGEPTTGVRRISVTEDECRWLAELSHDAAVLEIGTGLGISTRALGAVADRLTTVDPDPWVHENVWPQLPSDVETVASWPDDPYLYSIVFIDADHATEAVRSDIARAMTLKPYMIICHDAKMDSVKAALDDTWTLIDTHHGLAVKWVS